MGFLSVSVLRTGIFPGVLFTVVFRRRFLPACLPVISPRVLFTVIFRRRFLPACLPVVFPGVLFTVIFRGRFLPACLPVIFPGVLFTVIFRGRFLPACLPVIFPRVLFAVVFRFPSRIFRRLPCHNRLQRVGKRQFRKRGAHRDCQLFDLVRQSGKCGDIPRFCFRLPRLLRRKDGKCLGQIGTGRKQHTDAERYRQYTHTFFPVSFCPCILSFHRIPPYPMLMRAKSRYLRGNSSFLSREDNGFIM